MRRAFGILVGEPKASTQINMYGDLHYKIAYILPR